MSQLGSRTITVMPKAERLPQLLDCCLDLCEEHCFEVVGRTLIAEAAGCSPELVTHHFGKTEALHDAIIRHAIGKRHAPTLLQALAVGHKEVQDISPDLRRALAAWVVAAA